MPLVTTDFINCKINFVNNISILGGTSAISETTVQEIKTLLSKNTAKVILF